MNLFEGSATYSTFAGCGGGNSYAYVALTVSSSPTISVLSFSEKIGRRTNTKYQTRNERIFVWPRQVLNRDLRLEAQKPAGWSSDCAHLSDSFYCSI